MQKKDQEENHVAKGAVIPENTKKEKNTWFHKIQNNINIINWNFNKGCFGLVILTGNMKQTQESITANQVFKSFMNL